MSDAEQRKLLVEVWKTTVQVQQHFNDIEMRIRALAITAAAVAIKDGTSLGLAGLTVRLGAGLLLITLIAWILFYLVDQIWYHRMLLGAVQQGETIEGALSNEVPGVELTRAISAASPYQATAFGRKIGKPIHSSTKLKGFYWGVGVLLLVLAILAQLGGLTSAPPSYIRLTTVDATFCGAIVDSEHSVITIDDQFRHSKRSLPTKAIETESITQDCMK